MQIPKFVKTSPNRSITQQFAWAVCSTLDCKTQTTPRSTPLQSAPLTLPYPTLLCQHESFSPTKWRTQQRLETEEVQWLQVPWQLLFFSHKSRRKIAASNIGPIVKPASWLAPEETAGGFCGGLPQRCEWPLATSDWSWVLMRQTSAEQQRY